MRYRFLSWLKRSVFKTPEGQLPNKVMKFIYRCLFPLRSLYESQANVYYDPLSDSYKIDGIRYSREIFDFFAKSANSGELFLFVERKDGMVCIEKITSPVEKASN